MSYSKLARTASLVAFFLVLFCGAGEIAAEPSEAQIAAIKASCRSDYMSYCWSGLRGDPEAAQCLKKNLAKLSPGCQQAVKAATASAPATEAKPAAKLTPAAPDFAPPPPAETTKAAPSTIAPQTQDAATKDTSPAPAEKPSSPSFDRQSHGRIAAARLQGSNWSRKYAAAKSSGENASCPRCNIQSAGGGAR